MARYRTGSHRCLRPDGMDRGPGVQRRCTCRRSQEEASKQENKGTNKSIWIQLKSIMNMISDK